MAGQSKSSDLIDIAPALGKGVPLLFSESDLTSMSGDPLKVFVCVVTVPLKIRNAGCAGTS